MAVLTGRPGTPFGRHDSASAAAVRATALRAGLLAGCAASVCAALWLGDPRPALDADVELARLLRGMAVIKAAICLLALGALWWRFGHPTSRRLAAAYLLGAWLVAGASMLVWQLTLVPAAAIAFHAGELTLLIAAWRDGRGERRAARALPSRRPAVEPRTARPLEDLPATTAPAAPKQRELAPPLARSTGPTQRPVNRHGRGG